ncbi:transcription elongation factor GreAB [Marinomonas posidonica]|uniref:transcription elongation factor GreAB n=1 Tax=Marinomonas posidonica TaxID=936476 RepID=UPI0037364287
MNRKTAIDLIIRALEARFETARAAAQQAREAAINEESVAETKYDTFGLESSYLAHGQSQRVIECENDWLQFSRQVPIENDANDKVVLWSLIRLVPLNEALSLRYFFISNIAGGLSLQYLHSSLVLISPETPVGKILLGQEEGECISLTLAGQTTEFEIDSIQ